MLTQISVFNRGSDTGHPHAAARLELAHLEPLGPPCDKRPRMAREKHVPKPMSDGKLAYERRRAAKAGMSLEKWLDSKEREAELRAREERVEKPKAKRPGLFSRLIEKAHKPL